MPKNDSAPESTTAPGNGITAFVAALPKVTELSSRHASDERLYAKYKAMANGPTAPALSAARRRSLENSIRDFVLSGAELHGESKERFMQLQEQQAELAQHQVPDVEAETDRSRDVAEPRQRRPEQPRRPGRPGW